MLKIFGKTKTSEQDEVIAKERLARIIPVKREVHAREETHAPLSAAAGGTFSGGRHLFVSMRLLAAQWSERASRRLHADADLATPFPTPELLETEAHEQESRISQRQCALAAITNEDCPCILALTNGLTGILLEKTPLGEFIIDLDGQPEIFSADDLGPLYSGSLFHMQPGLEEVTRREEPQTRQASETQDGEDGKATSLIRYLLNHIWGRNRRLVLQLLAAAGLSNIMMITLPIFIMSVYDRVIPHYALETLWTLAIGVLVVLLLDLGLRYVRLNLVDALGLSASVKLQSKLYRHLTRMSLQDAPRTPGGLSDTLKEIESLCLLVPGLLIAVLADLPFIIAVMVLITYIGGAAVWGASIGTIAIALLIGTSFHVSRTRGKQDAMLLHTKTNQMTETIAALETIKATSSENRMLQVWERLTDTHAFASHHARLQNAFALQGTIVVSQAVIVLTVIIGVYQIGAGLMTVGNLAAITLLVGRVISPTSNLVALTGRAFLLSGILGRLASVLGADEEEAGDKGRHAGAAIQGRLTFHNVSFAYPESPEPSLAELSLTIEPGEKVGIIGRNGSGKSTFLRLIPRFLAPSQGAVTLDDYDLRQYDPRHIRQHIGFMSQDSVLFDCSLRDNICFGAQSVSDQWLEIVGRMTGVHEFAARHPEGYGMSVGPRGERLSGGERQAVSLARTLVANPDVLVLDEPTSAMDNTLEAHFIRAAPEILADKTVILTTHRTHLLALVDRVIWLDNGRIVADGPREDVLSSLRRAA